MSQWGSKSRSWSKRGIQNSNMFGNPGSRDTSIGGPSSWILPAFNGPPGACCPMAISAAHLSRTTTVKPGCVGSTLAAPSSMLRHCQAVDLPQAHSRGSEPCRAATCSNRTVGGFGQVSRTSHGDNLVLPKPRTTSTWLTEGGRYFGTLSGPAGGMDWADKYK